MSDEIRSYNDLIAWQKGMDLVESIYEATRRLPGEERYGLISQMRRCAVSIPSNVAEGWGRRSRQEYVRFLLIARGSLYELLTQIEICRRLGFDGDWSNVEAQTREAGRILQGLIQSLHQSKRAT